MACVISGDEVRRFQRHRGGAGQRRFEAESNAGHANDGPKARLRNYQRIVSDLLF